MAGGLEASQLTARAPVTVTAGLRDATAVVLAGGLGTRLAGVVHDRPKVLAAVRGRPFLAHLLARLAAAGARHVVLCTGHRHEQVSAAFGTRYAGMRLAYSAEPHPLGTGGALRLALPHLGSDPVLVLNGDSLCDVDLGELWAWHRRHGARASLVAVHVRDATRYGRLEIDRDARVVGFEEKGLASGPSWISAGIYVLARALVEAVPAGHRVSLEREVLPAAIEDGILAFRSRGAAFLDIGTPEAYAAAPTFVDALVRPRAVPAPRRVAGGGEA